MRSQDLFSLLRAYAVRTKSPVFDFREFLRSLPAAEGSRAEAEAALAELSGKGIVVSGQDVVIPDFPVVALTEVYRQLSVDSWRPFPRLSTLDVPIAEADVVSIDMKSGFTALLETGGPPEKAAVRLQFPEGIDDLVVPRAQVSTDLVEAAVAKISRYLHNGKNDAYAEAKLVTLIRGGDMLVHQSMEDATMRPKKAAAAVLSPNDFTFKFWTHLSNLVLQDFRKKKDKTAEDQGCCQAAYIVGYTVFYQKGAAQKEQERTADRKSLESLVRKPPYIFGYEEMYGLRDDKGIPFISKHSRGFITSFLDEKTRRAGSEGLPFLVRAHADAQNKDYFIHRDLLAPVFLKKLSEAAEELREGYINDWVAVLRREESRRIMKSDPAFAKDVEIRVKEDYPLLAALASGPLLYLARTETNISTDTADEISKCLGPDNSLRPLADLLGLLRVKLLKDARSYLPFWQTMPIIRQIVKFFRMLFEGRPARRREQSLEGRPARAEEVSGEEEASSPSAIARERGLAVYQRAVQALRSQYVPAGKTIDGTLAELAEKWNPLYAQEQKRHLVEDVNSLVRDYLRPIKRTFRMSPPTLQRIHALAEKLSESRNLEKIKKRDILMRYIELYMIKCLELNR
jgi:hypothetical protein